MRNRMVHKLHDQRGASLSMALFLMLVCAVIASVVLVSGTAAVGRFSELIKSDQRFYSVQSAAELIASDFTPTVPAGSTVPRNSYKIVRTHKATDGDTSTVQSAALSDSALVRTLSSMLLFGKAVPVAENATVDWNQWEGGAITPNSNYFDLTLSTTRTDGGTEVERGENSLQVKVEISRMTFDDRGATAVLDVYNNNGDAKQFHQRVTLFADYLDEDPVPYSKTNPDGTVALDYEQKETTITWRVTSITSVGEE